MILTADLTESHKTDTRSQQEIVVDSLLEKKEKDEKEPRTQSSPVRYGQRLTTTNDYPLLPFENDGTGFLRLDQSDPDYPIPFVNTLGFISQTRTVSELDLISIEKLTLSLNGSFFRANNSVSFASSFSFDLYCTVVIPNLSGGFQRLLQINCGRVNYNAITNSFVILVVNRLIDLTSVTPSQNFSQTETIQLTQIQYNLFGGNVNLTTRFGFDTDSVSSAIKQFLYSSTFVNVIEAEMIYNGLAIKA